MTKQESVSLGVEGWTPDGGNQEVGRHRELWEVSASVFLLLTVLQLRQKGKGCLRCVFCELQYGLKEYRANPWVEEWRWKTN